MEGVATVAQVPNVRDHRKKQTMMPYTAQKSKKKDRSSLTINKTYNIFRGQSGSTRDNTRHPLGTWTIFKPDFTPRR